MNLITRLGSPGRRRATALQIADFAQRNPLKFHNRLANLTIVLLGAGFVTGVAFTVIFVCLMRVFW